MCGILFQKIIYVNKINKISTMIEIMFQFIYSLEFVLSCAYNVQKYGKVLITFVKQKLIICM